VLRNKGSGAAKESELETSVPIPLDARKQQILKAVVADYTRTGIPVGSHALAVSLASWSSATIRNDLANLVDVGYLLQPHTSAGRVPSDRGYRYYVDFLMEEESLPPAVRRQIDPYFADLSSAVGDVLETAALALSVLTRAVSIVTGPKALTTVFKHLDLVSLDPMHALVILVLEGNLIRQQAIDLSSAADQDQLSALAASLRSELRGRPTAGVEDVIATPATGSPPGGFHPLREEILHHVLEAMTGLDARQDIVVVHDGLRNLLRQPEFGDLERLQQVLDVIEEERILGNVLASLEIDHGVRILIGSENDLEQLRECSLMVTTFRAGASRRGTIGILGPTRMRYSQLAPRVRHVSDRLGQALARMLG
jgi:heat-inducible transcriptional repressor